MHGEIEIRGAREHNLKNIDLTLPRDNVIVFSGVSGSGKSSLAFDTIFAEGQRRYMESLSSYARQFLGQMDKPDVDHIEGLSPSISIDQKAASKNPRSTVGTITEIHDYMRLLYSRIGIPLCPTCARRISKQTASEIIESISTLEEGSSVTIIAPIIKGKKGEHKKLLEEILKRGFVRIRLNGEMQRLDEGDIEVEKNKRNDIDVVVDRLKMKSESRDRIADSVETALSLGEGVVSVLVNGEERLYSEIYSCPYCDYHVGEMEPRNFSFNSPYGACGDCGGLGNINSVNPSLIIADEGLSINEGAIDPWKGSREFYGSVYNALSERYGVDLDIPFRELKDEQKKIILHGPDGETMKVPMKFRDSSGKIRRFWAKFDGIAGNLNRIYSRTSSDSERDRVMRYMSLQPCKTCKGARLKEEYISVIVGGLNIAQVSGMPIYECLRFFDEIELSQKEQVISERILKEIRSRLRFLVNVGLEYLTLDRTASTLSGGEAQRIRLATQVGSGLVGVLYVLDEPTIGLHQRDNKRLIDTLTGLRDLGNTLIIVEHDEMMMKIADFIVDIGPGAGERGGEIVASGTLERIVDSEESITGRYLKGDLRIDVPQKRRRSTEGITIEKACEHNLKNIDVFIPTGCFVCVTGVSGSGKSTLIEEILFRSLGRRLYRSVKPPGKHFAVKGAEKIERVVNVDQSPIGRTPRSNPATYTKAFDTIRWIFSQTREAKAKGYDQGRFSFNKHGGRCEACKGEGSITIEMQFLPDVYVPCDACGGLRYNRETLEIRYKGKTISDVLNMEVEEALEIFESIPKIKNHLEVLSMVGLGYVKLGQPAPTLSGGEAQRVKLASELSKRGRQNTMYILDEPTTGLHFDDINKLLSVLQELVERGNTVVVIEHNLDVVKCADWIIDLGPEGGDSGGYLIAEGTPESIAACEGSYTGMYLKDYLSVKQHSAGTR